MNAKNCLVGRRFSVKESINGWSEGLMNILDILIGLPDLGTKNLELKLHEERAKYLVCELKCPLEDTLGQYIDFIRRMIIKNSTEKGRIEEEKAPMLNFIFQTPQVRQAVYTCTVVKTGYCRWSAGAAASRPGSLS